MMTGGPPTSSLYPLADGNALRAAYVGRSLNDVGTPAAVIDISKAKINCKSMLDAVSRLGVNFRPHVKTHKTIELTRLQMGNSSKDVRLVVSTVMEAESLVPYLKECQQAGATVSVLYGVPFPPSSVARLARIANTLGKGCLAVMVDHPDQISACLEFKRLAGFCAGVFCKVDTGYHRAGIPPTSDSMGNLLKLILNDEKAGNLAFEGLYSHDGNSYGGNSANDAIKRLIEEIDQSMVAAKQHFTGSRRLTLSVGSTPTAVSIENLNKIDSKELTDTVATAKAQFDLELHAGVYTLLDWQQMSTHASTEKNVNNIALTVLAEVCSIYSDRERPEALIAAGTLSLGREPCKDYNGYGVVSPWNTDYTLPDDPLHEGLIVAKVSQEHGIIAHANKHSNGTLPLRVGQRIQIWPNHACIAGAGYGWYFIVDSETDSTSSKVVDVWVRWRGW